MSSCSGVKTVRTLYVTKYSSLQVFALFDHFHIWISSNVILIIKLFWDAENENEVILASLENSSVWSPDFFISELLREKILVNSRRETSEVGAAHLNSWFSGAAVTMKLMQVTSSDCSSDWLVSFSGVAWRLLLNRSKDNKYVFRAWKIIFEWETNCLCRYNHNKPLCFGQTDCLSYFYLLDKTFFTCSLWICIIMFSCGL